MNELIVVNGQRMTSVQIAELTGKNHKDVLRDIRNLIDQGAITERNFALSEYKDASGKSNPMYTMDFQATMVLVTGYDAVKRAAVISRWTELERKTHQPVTIPTHAEALRLAADLVEKNEALQKKIEIDQPKVDLAEAISKSSKSISFSDFAKLISNQEGFVIGEINLCRMLRALGMIDNRNMPKQRYLDAGWFDVAERTYKHEASNGPRPYNVTLITGQGQVSVLEKMKKSGRIVEFLNKSARANKHINDHLHLR